MNMTQPLWLMYKGKGNLPHKIREGYMNDSKMQRLFGEFCKGKALNEVKLVDGLLKYEKS